MVEAQTLVFPGHEKINLTNDSCQLSRLDHSVNQLNKIVKQKPKQTLRDLIWKKAVSYQDVSHVHSVTLHGQPQRKGLGPDLSLNKIKVVKGVSCVSQCLSAPSIPNPHMLPQRSVLGEDFRASG